MLSLISESVNILDEISVHRRDAENAETERTYLTTKNTKKLQDKILTGRCQDTVTGAGESSQDGIKDLPLNKKKKSPHLAEAVEIENSDLFTARCSLSVSELSRLDPG